MEIRHNSSFAFDSQSARRADGITLPQTVSGVKSPLPAPSTWNIKDEYISSSAVSLVKSSSALMSESQAISASDIDNVISRVMKSHGVNEDDHFGIILVIGKDGKFQSGGGSFHNEIHNWDDQNQGELGTLIDDLNNTTIKGISLAEAMLQNFADASGMDLSTERNKDSFYFTTQIINPSHHNKTLGIESDIWVKSAVQIVTVDNTFYSREDDKRSEGGLYYYYDKDKNEYVLKMVLGELRAVGINALDAPWNQNKSIVTSVTSNASFETNDKQKKESLIDSFISHIDTNILNMAIKQILKDNGFELKSGDSVGFDVSSTGVHSFDRNSSNIAGLDEMELDEVGKILDSALQNPDFWNNPSLYKRV
ncbi:MAG: hypothetical protein LBE13_00980 [Bacteroidales bacterium]|nr:hypothetical protein [Bacteroidales bacterium]